MKMKWLATTTAIAVMFGTGALVAQQPEQKRDEKSAPRAQIPEKEPGRPAAGDQMKGRTTGQAQEKAGPSEPPQAETSSPADRGKQAQEPSGRESREPTRQSQEQPAHGERTPSTAQEEQKGRDTGQSTERQRGRENQKDERVQDTKQPADNKQTTEQDRAREGQKEERAQDNRRPDETKQQQQSQQERDRSDQMSRQRQGENAGQAEDRTNRRSEINDNQRREIVDRLQREKTAFRQHVNLQVNVGERLPPRVEARRLPPDIVRIAPQYRDYEYTVIDNRIAIVDPRNREVVDFIDEGPDYGRTGSYNGDRVVISDDVRTSLKQLARRSSNTVGSSSGGSTCLSLQPVPEDMVRNHPELSSYRYLSIGDEVVLIDPQQQKVVQVID
jgi:hypothetical protein